MIDLNEFYARYCANQEKTKFEMVQTAARKLFNAVQRDEYYTAEDLKSLNFAEICAWCDWPDFQDGGIFEQAIITAANMVLDVI